MKTATVSKTLKGPPEESEEHRLKKFLQEVENMSENLIGLDEAHTDDPLRQVLVLQKQMQLLQEGGQNLMRRRAKLNSEPSEANDSKDSLHVAVQGPLLSQALLGE